VRCAGNHAHDHRVEEDAELLFLGRDLADALAKLKPPPAPTPRSTCNQLRQQNQHQSKQEPHSETNTSDYSPL
jgi:hypothetical protein